MSEGIIDVLQHFYTHSASFVADKDVDYVELSIPAGDQMGELITNSGVSVFQEGENFIILSIGCVMPLSFQFWNDDTYLRNGAQLWFNQVGTANTRTLPRMPSIWFPFESYEMSLGMFFNPRNVEAPIETDFFLRAKFSEVDGNFARISMLNMPESLNEKTFYVPIFMKVLHTYDLYAEPS